MAELLDFCFNFFDESDTTKKLESKRTRGKAIKFKRRY